MDIIAKARVYRAIIEKAMATADEQFGNFLVIINTLSLKIGVMYNEFA